MKIIISRHLNWLCRMRCLSTRIRASKAVSLDLKEAIRCADADLLPKRARLVGAILRELSRTLSTLPCTHSNVSDTNTSTLNAVQPQYGVKK